MGKSTIDKLKESGKLEFNATVRFNFKDDIMDRYRAKTFLYDAMGEFYRQNMNLFESIEMDIKWKLKSV